jgi:hypothetical protein
MISDSNAEEFKKPNLPAGEGKGTGWGSPNGTGLINALAA